MTDSSNFRLSREDLQRLGDYSATRRMLLMTALAVPVGAVGAVVAWLLLRLIGLITNLIFWDRVDTRLVLPGGGHANPLVLLFAPVLGGLLVGLIARFGSQQIRGHGIPEAIESILLGDSKVAPRVSILKPLASAITIGTGGPFGAEGPIIMTGGAIGSLFAQFLHLTSDERKVLLVAGSVAGMAATFNTPFASIMFAVELLLFEWRPRSYVPVTAAVVVATLIRYPLLGSNHLFRVPLTPLHLTTPDYLLCVVLGIAAGLLAVVATALVYFAEDNYPRLHIHWMWWPAVGGLIIGIGGLISPDSLGVGYTVIGAELNGSMALKLAIGLLVVKTLIWGLSLGSGTSGGILAPMFMVGGALGVLASHVFPEVAPGFWALVALAGVLGGVMRSPLTGVIFALELTHRFDAVLPLIIGASAAFAISVLILKRSVLTEKIARHGNHLTREYDVDPLENMFVGHVMAYDVLKFPRQLTVADAFESISGTDPTTVKVRRQMLYPIVDDADHLLGIITRTQLEIAMHAGRGTTLVGDHGISDPVIAYTNESLREAAMQMAVHKVDRLLVVERTNPTHILGIISVTMMLAARAKDAREAGHTERVLRLRIRRQKVASEAEVVKFVEDVEDVEDVESSRESNTELTLTVDDVSNTDEE